MTYIHGPCDADEPSYPTKFKFDISSINKDDRDKLCEVRKKFQSKYGSKKLVTKPCQSNNGKCWDKEDILMYIDNLKTFLNTKEIDFWMLFEYTNVVMGRWMRPSEFMEFLKQTKRKASVLVKRFDLKPSDGKAFKPNYKDSRITDLISGNFVLNRIGEDNRIFYIWIKNSGRVPEKNAKNVWVANGFEGVPPKVINKDYSLRMYSIFTDDDANSLNNARMNMLKAVNDFNALRNKVDIVYNDKDWIKSVRAFNTEAKKFEPGHEHNNNVVNNKTTTQSIQNKPNPPFTHNTRQNAVTTIPTQQVPYNKTVMKKNY